MSIEYVVTKRVFGFDQTGTEKYVVTPVSSGDVSFEKLCANVGQICGVHRGVIQLVVAGLIDAMINAVDDGKSVHLGDFGTFRASFKTKAADSPDDANANCIYRRRIVFTPGKAFKNALKDMRVTRFAMPDTDWTDRSGGTGGSGGSGTGGSGTGGSGGENPNPGEGEGGWNDPTA